MGLSGHVAAPTPARRHSLSAKRPSKVSKPLESKPEKSVFCGKCPKSFTSSALLHSHLASHSKKRPYNCPTCSASYKSMKNLTKHKEYVHSSYKERKFVCAECSNRFCSGYDLRRHVQSHRKEVAQPTPSSQVKVEPQEDDSDGSLGITPTDSTPRPSSRSTRSSVHNSDSPSEPPKKISVRGRNPCPKCDKRFATISDLKRHSSVHVEVRDRTHKCIICPQSFPTIHRLQNHLRYHIKEDPYTCYFCQKRFILSDKLKRHVYSHTGEKPYRCSSPRLTTGWRCKSKQATGVCGNSFVSADKLKRHMKRHK